MPVYIEKSGDFIGCYNTGRTNKRTRKDWATRTQSAMDHGWLRWATDYTYFVMHFSQTKVNPPRRRISISLSWFLTNFFFRFVLFWSGNKTHRSSSQSSQFLYARPPSQQVQETRPHAANDFFILIIPLISHDVKTNNYFNMILWFT